MLGTLITLAGAGAAAAYAVRGTTSSFFAPSVYRGSRSRRSIALTFDDGPTGSTPRILELLHQYGVRATFFQCGAQVRRRPEVAREVAAAGHEIGNHGDSHRMLCFRSAEWICGELAQAQESIVQATGAAPRLFRAPYGVRWFGLREAQRRMGLLGVMWTVMGCDWKWPADRICAGLLRGAENGAILCLHDGRGPEPDPDIAETIAAVRAALPRLLDRGYHFETVSQLLCPKN
jgi:peptidoglycan/xylan/chitin deacetylase (PgdA/CDA1 family)